MSFRIYHFVAQRNSNAKSLSVFLVKENTYKVHTYLSWMKPRIHFPLEPEGSKSFVVGADEMAVALHAGPVNWQKTLKTISNHEHEVKT